MPIVVSEKASPATRQYAQTLADYLQKISEAPFRVENGNGQKGIVVGRAADFAQWNKSFDAENIGEREAYILRSGDGVVWLIGATDAAVSHAVWDFLYEIGYRRFFPGENWEIVPQKRELTVRLDKKTAPDYWVRDLFVAHGLWENNAPRWQEWRAANRLGKSFSLNTGHSWEKIQERFKDEFAAHPEYFALVKGERRTTGRRLKFELANPRVRQLVAQYAVEFFDQNPQEESVSIEPTDSGGWSESPEAKAIGSVSDQMVVLANDVIDAVRAKYPHKYVAFYAYSSHAPAPSLTLKPGAIVSVTTAIRKGDASFDDLIRDWQKQGAVSGIRDYAGVASYESFGVPYQSLSSRVNDYVRALENYSTLGVKFYRTELGDDFGSNGLGYYLATRILWDKNEVQNVPALIDDFLEKSFGEAKEPMRRFYGLINGLDGTAVPSFEIGSIRQLYAVLDEAWKSTSDAAVHRRLGDMVLYVHFLEKYHRFLDASGSQRQRQFEETLRFAYRSSPSHMVHSRSMYSTAFNSKFGRMGEIPAAAGLRVPEGKNPWKSSRPFSQEEILGYLKQGLTLEETRPYTNLKVSVVPRSEQVQETPQSTFYLRGRHRILLKSLRDTQVRILPLENSDSLFSSSRSYTIKDGAGKIVQVGQLQKGRPITFQAQAGEHYFLSVFVSNYSGVYKLQVTGAAAALQNDLDHGKLHLFEDPAVLFVDVPPALSTWDLSIQTHVPGEAARIKVFRPDGTQAAAMETGPAKEQTAILKAAPGFWRVELDKASTGILYSNLLTFDEKVSRWISMDKNYFLRVE